MAYLAGAIILAVILAALALALVASDRVLADYGTCAVDINAGARAFEADGGQTLLETLYGADVFIPSACGGRGTCGYCKVTALSGGGAVLPTERPLLTRREIRAGVRLACQVKVKEDARLAIPEELLNVQRYEARVTRAQRLTHDIVALRLALVAPEEIVHRPGQYVQIQAPSVEGPVFRAYSISSPEHETRAIELVVKLVPGGIASTYLHGLEQGDLVVFTGPFGDFVLSEDPEVEVVCVGGGCGMAPIRNIILSLCARWPERACRFFFGCRTREDVFFLDEYRDLARRHPNFQVVYALSDEAPPPGEWDGETGFIHLALDKHLAPGGRRQAFLCGPPPMIEAVMRVLEDKGLAPEDVYYDKFE